MWFKRKKQICIQAFLCSSLLKITIKLQYLSDQLKEEKIHCNMVKILCPINGATIDIQNVIILIFNGKAIAVASK